MDNWRTYISPLTTRTEDGEESALPAIALEPGVRGFASCWYYGSPFDWDVLADEATHAVLATKYDLLDDGR